MNGFVQVPRIGFIAVSYAGELNVTDLLGRNLEIVLLIFTELERIATENQRAGKGMRRMRENRSRKPLVPSTALVSRIPTMLGPRSMAGNIIRPANLGMASPRRRCGAARAPGQETAKVKAK